jgi:hypothetical protein
MWNNRKSSKIRGAAGFDSAKSEPFHVSLNGVSDINRQIDGI